VQLFYKTCLFLGFEVLSALNPRYDNPEFRMNVAESILRRLFTGVKLEPVSVV